MKNEKEFFSCFSLLYSPANMYFIYISAFSYFISLYYVWFVNKNIFFHFLIVEKGCLIVCWWNCVVVISSYWKFTILLLQSRIYTALYCSIERSVPTFDENPLLIRNSRDENISAYAIQLQNHRGSRSSATLLENLELKTSLGSSNQFSNLPLPPDTPTSHETKYCAE